ncbi:MAG: GNAT family N-acetyltransferase [Candidatus Omnitrophica bacterium]|nr:GNAT family N-acetyltransferase [Candidatus Omnitrophota bacterium]
MPQSLQAKQPRAARAGAAEPDDTYLYMGRTFRIRETRASDVPVWYKWFNDPEITRQLIHGIIPNTLERQEQFRLAHLDGSSKILFSIIAREEPRLIGTCSINIHGHWSNGHAEISLVIGDTRYHKGPLYLEVTMWQLDHAFLMLNMHSVFAATSAENAAVRATLERLGFREAGVLREGRYRNGKYLSSVLYDLLKDEWLARRRAFQADGQETK